MAAPNAAESRPPETVAEGIVRFLKSLGVERIHGCPGSTDLAFMAASRAQGIEYLFLIHESTAVGTADGYARATNRLAVVNLHASQGLLNAAGFIRVALRDRVPLLIFAGVPSTTYDVCEPNHFTSSLQQCLTPITKWTWTLSNSQTLPAVLRKAVVHALSPPSGPVVICVPQNILESPLSGGGDSPFVEQARLPAIPSTVPSAPVCRHLAEALRNARRPVIFAGFGSRYCPRAVETLAQRLAAPVVAESLDRGTQLQHVYCRGDHELFLGFFDRRDEDIAACIHAADVLVFIGARATYARVIGDLPQGCVLVHITDSYCDLGKDYPPDIPVIGDVEATLQMLCEQLGELTAPSDVAVRQARYANLVAARRKRRAEMLDRVAMGGSPVLPMQLVKAMLQCSMEGVALVDDSQCMGYYLKHFFPFRRPDSLYGSLAGHIGWGLPAALGVKLARPTQPVACLLGDTAFLFGGSGLTAAAAYSIPILVIIANNRGSVSLRTELEQRHGSSEYLQNALAFQQFEFRYEDVAKGMGVEAFSVSDSGDLAEALRRGLAIIVDRKTACVIDVHMSAASIDWRDSWHVVGAE